MISLIAIFLNKILTKLIYYAFFVLGAPKGSEKGAFFDVSSRPRFFIRYLTTKYTKICCFWKIDIKFKTMPRVWSAYNIDL